MNKTMDANLKRLIEKNKQLETLKQTPKIISLRKKISKVILKFYRLGAMEGIIKQKVEKHTALLEEIKEDLTEIEKEIPTK